jgi:transposase
MTGLKDERRTDGRHVTDGSRDLSEPEIGMPESASVRQQGVGRPSVVEAFRSRITTLLEADPSLKTADVLRRMRRAGYGGGKSALYEMVRVLRPHGVSPLSHLTHLPGLFSQHDFGEVRVRYLTGRGERIHFFVSRLKYSRWIDVRLMEDRRIESLVRSLLGGFESFGGVPLVAVFENSRTLVLNRDGQRIEWNGTFGQCALDYRFAPELCTPSPGQERREVERLVSYVKGNFFRVRHFQDHDDLVARLAEWHREVNTVAPRRATGVTALSRLDVERERLRPLAIPPAEYALRFPVMVDPPGVVEFHGCRYAMPAEAVGLPGLLWLHPQSVTIIAGRCVATHARVSEREREIPSPEHRTARPVKVGGDASRRHHRRHGILDLDAVTEVLPSEGPHHHRLSWKTQVE